MNILELPKISVIMPVRNESAYITRSLGSVIDQDYPPHLVEVVVVDGASTDDTKIKIDRISRRYPDRQIKVIDNPRQFMAMGFNRGLDESHGEIILMMGGHAELSTDYLIQCVKVLKDESVDCVGGAMETIAEGWVSQVIAIAMSSLFGVGGVAFRTHPDRVMEVDTAVYAAYRSLVFEQIGKLDEEMIRNQDDEFNYRLREHGGRILFSPSIRSRYYSRSSFLSLWKQYYQYGYYKVRVLQKHPRQMSLRQFVPPAFVLALLASALLALLSISFPRSSVFGLPSFPIFGLLSLVIPFLYLAANLLASLYTASKRGWKFLPLLPLTFTILHLSYGLGFLAGLFKFWNRWNDKMGKEPAYTREPT